ncbi:MAG: DUF5717 family protein [Lachnotalea sp.]
MRERVEELERGDFNNNTPKIDVSTPLIEMNLNVDEICEGSFLLKSLNFYKMKGVVCTSTYRMQCVNPQFIGQEAKIQLRFNGKGICEGETIKGFIYIISNGGEFSLPFVVHIQKKVMISSIGKITNLFHFTNLAMVNWNEAYQLFKSPEFTNVFINNDTRYESMYIALTSGEFISEQSMEEFLIGIKKKSAISVKIDKMQQSFYKLSSDEREIIQISKSTWGYVKITIKAEADFIHLDNHIITTNDFIGSNYQLAYIIKKNRLHSGKNFGRIIISTIHSELVYEITASVHGENESNKERKDARIKKKCLLELTKLYTSYRSKKINANMWAKECMGYVTKLREIDSMDQYYKLLNVQLLFIEKKNHEAHELLEEFDFNRKAIDENVELYVYYIYLTTFWNKDKRYLSKMVEEIKKIYHKNRYNWPILWVLLYLDVTLQQDIPHKFTLIEGQYLAGCESPIMYVEAYRIMKSDSFLITKLGRFELQVLWWAVKNRVLSKDVVIQIANLTVKMKEFNNILFKILSYGYDQFKEKDILHGLCGLLIKGNKIATKYFKWYSLGVEQDVRITRLYDYYMYSIPQNYTENIPRPVLMYFGYYNNLDFRKSALLYERVIKQRDVLPELFQSYRRHIEVFMLEQLMLKRNNEKLAFIYDTMLSLNIITPDIAKAISGIIFGCELYCENSQIKSASVIHRHLGREKIYPIIDNKAYINIYSKDYAITFLDKEGNRYLDSIHYSIKNLMDEAFYVKKCFELKTESKDIKFNIALNLIDSNNITNQHLDLLIDLINEPNTKESYKVILRNVIIKYCYDHYEDDNLITYITELDFKQIDNTQRCVAIEYLVVKGLYNEAFENIVEYGYECIKVKQLVKLASRLISLRDFEEDEIIVSMSAYVLEGKKYDEIILKYLIAYFSGSTMIMKDIWSAAYKFDLDTYELSERLILQVLFTNSYIDEIEHIFECYYRKGSRFHIAQAFLTYNAYNYLVFDKEIGNRLFEYIEKEQNNEGIQNDTCKLAMLKYYSKYKKLSIKEEAFVHMTLKEFINRKMYFKFYEQYNDKILKPYCYEGKYMVEYKSNINRKIFIHYIQENSRGDGEYKIEEMKQAYPGIYNKIFTVFYGEKVQYYITEADNFEHLVENNVILVNEMNLNSERSRYSMLNDMSVALHMNDDKTLLELMDKYANDSQVVDELFEMI